MTTGVVCRTLGVKVLRVYKSIVSPWLPPACRFTPTCSEYAVGAIEKYGLIHGVVRAIGRLLRCHPLHRGGFDPLT
ncbi:MAG: membrane protein insertion efficiency factor YidD [Acidobacteria bacterium]|nr:MAG: membrane protein insertion efficiency factor YidD [Acidobacteriota bacterium]